MHTSRSAFDYNRGMPTDNEIARSTVTRPVVEIAEKLGLGPDDLRPYGRFMAKVDPAVLRRPRERSEPNRLILVSALTPTKAGEGKTTTSIGLAQGLASIGESVALALREPSLGPAFGMKGGATGGGRSQVVPRERINLHFTGDFHAITSAHNLLAAVLDNHIYFGQRSWHRSRGAWLWRRVMDMNDRALRRTSSSAWAVTKQGVPRETGFDITAASEIMAMLCLADDHERPPRRIDRTILVGFTYDGRAGHGRSRSGASGAMLALLQDALMPNLVQTTRRRAGLRPRRPLRQHRPRLQQRPGHSYGHPPMRTGRSPRRASASISGRRSSSTLSVVQGEVWITDAVVLVTTIRALKLHGGARTRRTLSRTGHREGRPRDCLENLDKHIEKRGSSSTSTPVVDAEPLSPTDTDEEIAIVRERAECA